MRTLLKTLAFCVAVLGAYGVGTWHAFVEPAKAEPAPEPPPGQVIVLTDEVRDKCEAEGGCRLISLKTAHDLVMQEAKKRAGNCMGSASHRLGES